MSEQVPSLESVLTSIREVLELEINAENSKVAVQVLKDNLSKKYTLKVTDKTSGDTEVYLNIETHTELYPLIKKHLS